MARASLQTWRGDTADTTEPRGAAGEVAPWLEVGRELAPCSSQGVTAGLGCPERRISIKICICSQCKSNLNVSQEDKFSKKAQ